MKRCAWLLGAALALLSSLAFAQATTVPLYVTALSQGTADWSFTTIPSTFNGATANTVPEQWSIQALLNVKYAGTTTVKLLGGTTEYCGGRVGCSFATTTISTTGVLTATPTLLSSTAGGALFTVYANGTTYGFFLDQGLTTPVSTDVYGNVIDPSTAGTGSFVQPDGTTVTAPTAGTAYVACPSCANLPNYSMPCNVPDGMGGLLVVYAPDCESDPVNYYGLPITGYVQTCGTPQTADPISGEITQNYQQCAPTWSGGGAQIQHNTFLTGAYTPGAAAVDSATGNPIVLVCTGQSCVWSGSLPLGFYLLTGAGTAETCFRGVCRDQGNSLLQYPVVTPPAPPPPPPVCPPSCGDDSRVAPSSLSTSRRGMGVVISE